MVLTTRKNGRAKERGEETGNDAGRNDPDLRPEYCAYQDEGCEHAASCLECPFPRCLHEVPYGARQWFTRRRNGGMARLRREGWKVRELALLYGVSERTVQRALNHRSSKEESDDAD